MDKPITANQNNDQSTMDKPITGNQDNDYLEAPMPHSPMDKKHMKIQKSYNCLSWPI